jgi:hypothetical protein
MRKLLVAVLIAGSIVSFEAKAQERAGSAALGAVSGAVVLGPVGAVAGALIGDIPQDPQSCIPGELGIPHRAPAPGV